MWIDKLWTITVSGKQQEIIKLYVGEEQLLEEGEIS